MASPVSARDGAPFVAPARVGCVSPPPNSYPPPSPPAVNFFLAAAIFLTGLCYYVAICSIGDNAVCPQFEPLAMLGGAIWFTGNLCVVPIVQCIGLGLGLCIWGSSNMLAGWASAHFGILGVQADPTPSSLGLHYTGVAMAVCATLTFLMIKSSVGEEAAGGGEAAGKLLAADDAEYGYDVGAVDGSLQAGGASASAAGKSWADALSPGARSAVGIGLSLFSGVCYGVNFNPPQYVRAHPERFPGAPQDLTAYIFPHFCGIFLLSAIVFVGYAIAKRNAPVVYAETSLPALASGVIWAIAQIGFFYGNAALGQSISFPIISTGPSLVGSLWGALVFGEIKGRRNFLLLGVAFAFVIGAALCIALSK